MLTKGFLPDLRWSPFPPHNLPSEPARLKSAKAKFTDPGTKRLWFFNEATEAGWPFPFLCRFFRFDVPLLLRKRDLIQICFRDASGLGGSREPGSGEAVACAPARKRPCRLPCWSGFEKCPART